MKYTDRVMNSVNSMMEQFEGISAEEKRLKEQYAREEIAGKVFNEKTAELRARREEVRGTILKQIEKARADYQGTVERNGEISASMLHDDAKLLQMEGLNLTKRQFTALVQRHQDNPLMAQLLRNYQQKHEGLYSDYVPDTEQKIKDFDDFASAARATVRDPDTMQAAFFLSGRYTPKYANESDGQE